MIFSFLWGSTSKTKKFHLVDWHLLARPISHGGWGIKHLPSFSLSLRMKRFWLVLNSNGIWNHLIAVKYLKNKPLHIWLKDKNFITSNASIIWRGFIYTISWIGRGIIWKVGNGESISLGADPFIGMGSSFVSSSFEQIDYLILRFF